MGNVVVTLKVMPEGVDEDLNAIKEKVNKEIASFSGEAGKVSEEELAFGLKSLNFIFVLDESKGGVDPLEEKIKNIEGVRSAEVVDVRKAIG